jgi:8-oxo-dGTP pyrophosphatase MutT (NUDIX family)
MRAIIAEVWAVTWWPVQRRLDDAVIDTTILAAIEARFVRAFALPDVRYRPFAADGVRLGFVDRDRAARLARFAAFRVDEQGVTLNPRLDTCEARSAALADVALALRAEGALPAWRDEVYDVAACFAAPPVFRIERGAARYLGVRTYAAHLNGIVAGEDGTKMWFARRSATKPVDPGLLDNLVGGGIAAGMRVDDTLFKEAWEEAGIAQWLARRARPAGVVHVCRAMFDGLQRETVFVHDLDVPADFAPANQDGEAVEHRLVALAEAARLIAQSSGPDEVTLDASVVVLDYLIRRGEIAPDEPAFAALEALRQSCRPT